MKATAPPILSGVWGLPGVFDAGVGTGFYRVYSGFMPGLGVALEARNDGTCVVADHVQVGGHGAVRLGERVHVEHAAESCAGGVCDLAHRVVRDGGFTEHGRNLVLAHVIDRGGNLRGGRLLFGVDRPNVLFLQARVCRQVGEGTFTGCLLYTSPSPRD